MSRIAVLGESPQVDFYRTTGALVIIADGPDAVRSAWESVPDDVAVVVLTAAAVTHLPDAAESASHQAAGAYPDRLVAVMP